MLAQNAQDIFQYIAQQLEVVTNTLGVFERRLTRNEDLIQEMRQQGWQKVEVQDLTKPGLGGFA